jgi:hypothetical protein
MSYGISDGAAALTPEQARRAWIRNYAMMLPSSIPAEEAVARAAQAWERERQRKREIEEAVERLVAEAE